jgi:hypothetical protein
MRGLANPCRRGRQDDRLCAPSPGATYDYTDLFSAPGADQGQSLA